MIVVLLTLGIGLVNGASTVFENDQNGLRQFEFPNDQPGGMPMGGNEVLQRQGITNGTVLNVSPGLILF